MIDHLQLAVGDFPAARAFYAAVLAPLGLKLLREIPAAVTGDWDAAGFGPSGDGEFWIVGGGPTRPHLHLAFRVDTPEMVDAFFRAALQAGGRDNGAPGLRPLYQPNYYAAFVLDPEGHNIEAVCFLP